MWLVLFSISKYIICIVFRECSWKVVLKEIQVIWYEVFAETFCVQFLLTDDYSRSKENFISDLTPWERVLSGVELLARKYILHSC